MPNLCPPESSDGTLAARALFDGGLSANARRVDHQGTAGAGVVRRLRAAPAQALVRPGRDVRGQLRLSLGPEQLDGRATSRRRLAPSSAWSVSSRATWSSTSAATTRPCSRLIPDDTRRIGIDPTGVEVRRVLRRARADPRLLLRRCRRRDVGRGQTAPDHLDRHVLRPRVAHRLRDRTSRESWPTTASGTSSRATCRRCFGRTPTTRSATSTSSTTRSQSSRLCSRHPA